MNLFELYATIALDPSEYESGVRKATKSGSDLKENLVKVGKDIAKGFAVVTGAITAVGATLLGVESATEEYRIAQGKLNTAFEAAGYKVETAKGVYQEFYRILGDTDTATEASQLLAKLALNQEDMATWTRTAAGVWGTFGSALPIESLIESANETARVGQVTGTLADALNWASISEDEFNAALSSCGSEAERNQLIMNTLAEEYDGAADSFYKNNEALIANRDAQSKVTDALAKVGESVSTIKATLIEAFAPAIEEAATKFADFASGLDIEEIATNVSEKLKEIVSTFEKLLPVITGVTAAFIAYKTAAAISGIIDALRVATESQTIAQAALNLVMNANPFVLVATLIAGLVAALVTLWNTNEGFRNAVIKIWEAIKDAFSSAWEAIKGVWEQVKPYFEAIWEGIQSAFSVAKEVLSGYFRSAWEGIRTAWAVAVSYFQTIWNNIKLTFSVVQSVLTGDFQGAWDGIKSIFTNWGSFFSGLIQKVKDLFSKVFGIMSEPIEKAKTFIKEAVEKIKGFFDFEWKLPKIKLPHFSISGKFSLNPPSIPKFGVSWYAKAMRNPMLLNGATIFGAYGNTLLGGGEAGPEVVSGADTLMDMIKNAVTSVSVGSHKSDTKVVAPVFNITVNGAQYDSEDSLIDGIMYRLQEEYDRRSASIA